MHSISVDAGHAGSVKAGTGTHPIAYGKPIRRRRAYAPSIVYIDWEGRSPRRAYVEPPTPSRHLTARDLINRLHANHDLYHDLCEVLLLSSYH